MYADELPPSCIIMQLCIPDWPMFNRNKVVWLEEVGKSNATKANKSKSSQPGSTKKAKKAAEAKSS